MSEPLTVIDHEKFAAAVVRLGTATAAWKEVFDPEALKSHSTAWEMGCRMSSRPDVSRRISVLRGEALAGSQIQVVEMMRDLYDIATADPNEIVRTIVVNCRCCHGDANKYQWRDVAEFTAACAKVEAENEARRERSKTGRVREEPLPEMDGGFGFTLDRPPHPMCPVCVGAGEARVVVSDTTRLSTKAAKLFKGVRQKADGSIEVFMHDQIAARDQLHRLAGAYKDSLALPNLPNAGEVKPGANVQQTYLSMIAGGKRVA